MKFLAKHIKAFLADEQGATAIEYGLLAALIAVAIILGAAALGTNLNTLFDSIATRVGNVVVN